MNNAHELYAEIKRLKEWVADLQKGTFINCVYCGHRYGPNHETPVSMADVLKAHVEQCPEHPMSELKKDKERVDWLEENIVWALRNHNSGKGVIRLSADYVGDPDNINIRSFIDEARFKEKPDDDVAS